jgi:LPXTG-site transpeptidase (sortase) family protein
VYQKVYSPLDQIGGAGDSILISPEGSSDIASAGSSLAAVSNNAVTSHYGSDRRFSNDANPFNITSSNNQKVIPHLIPERMVIDAIGVDAYIVPVQEREIEYLGDTYFQWDAPRSGQLGWHNSSARIGSSGNTVINGHSSGYGDTFAYLADLQYGDIIEIHADNYRFSYFVTNVNIVKERWEPIETRISNAAWINGSDDERITLVSCWPNNSSTHRIIVAAVPLDFEIIKSMENPNPSALNLR